VKGNFHALVLRGGSDSNVVLLLDLLALFRFIDWIISLPKECEAEYMKNVAKLEKEEFGKNFICPAEQLWLEEGMEKGSAITAQKIAMKMLGKKGISITEIAKITGVSITELKRLKDKKH